MSEWEMPGASDEWYTPKYIFDALGCEFDMDVAHPLWPTHVPRRSFLFVDSLATAWQGFVWMNPPFGGRNAIAPWLAKFFEHGNGIALTPDRTSAPWFQRYAPLADTLLFVSPKIKFERPDGSTGNSPGSGTCLWAAGDKAAQILRQCKLGFQVAPVGSQTSENK